MIKKGVSLLLALALLAGAAAVAETQEDIGASSGAAAVDTTTQEPVKTATYAAYLEAHGDAAHPADTLCLEASAAQIEGGKLDAYEGKAQVARMETDGRLRWVLPEMTEGLYCLLVTYASQGGTGRDFRLALTLDGALPFEQAEEFVLRKMWVQPTVQGGGFPVDSSGNEYAATLEEKIGWQDAYLMDTDGLQTQPLQFFLKAGQTLELAFSRGGVAVESLTLLQYKTIPSYAQLQEAYAKEGRDGKAAADLPVIQAERPAYVSDSMLIPLTDRMSAATQPQDANHIKLNTLGGLNWQYNGQKAVWEFDVPAGGLYTIRLRVRQNFQRGVTVSRRIGIDGEVPCAELDNYKFPFSDKWQVEELGDDEPYRFYLEAGHHTLSMEAVVAYPDLIQGLQDAQFKLNALYRQVIMVAGSQPDPMRDYELDKAIPDFMQQVRELGKQLSRLLDTAYGYGFAEGGETVNIEQLIDMLAGFLKVPDEVPSRLTVFKDNISALGNWINSLTQQPLQLDTIVIASPDSEPARAEAGFFRNIGYSFQLFFASFSADYNTVGGEDALQDPLTVWVSLGRDQAQVIKQQVDNDFIPRYNRQVRLSLVQQGLIQATLAGKGPDVSIFTSPTDTINLAVRGALTDLSVFGASEAVDSFETVTKRFHPTSLIPYQYDGKTYALPVEEQFNMMFYRTDVFDELHLEPPTTWEEMEDVISVLSRNNLEVGIPTEVGGTNTRQSINETVFQTILYQNGGTYYRDGWKSTAFDTPQAVSAFRQWTDFFTKYSLPVEYDFFSRFRTGEMPLGIATYTTYNLLSIGAPEIRGLWKMVKVPGTPREDGSINSTVTGAGNGIILFDKTKDKDTAWSFIQWFTSASVQGDYAWQIESLMGPSARFDSANVEAFKTLAWDAATRDQLLSQWEEMEMIPQIPAGYYVARSITNAFRKVVIAGGNPRETLGKYNRDMNTEITRKRKTLGLD